MLWSRVCIYISLLTLLAGTAKTEAASTTAKAPKKARPVASTVYKPATTTTKSDAPQTGWEQAPNLPPGLADSAYIDAMAAMAPPIQRTDRLMVRWPGIIYANAVIVLMYHNVAPFVSALPATISTKQMQDHLEYLRDEGFNIITMQQFTDFVLKGSPVPYNAVLITFDDGYRSFYSYVYPLLQKMNMQATNFLILANTEHLNNLPHLPTLEWDQVKEMQHSGFANFETHAYKGHNYARFIPGNKQRPWYLARIYDPVTKRIETETSYQTRVSADLYRARTLISNRLGGERLAFAYPYGARDDASDHAAHLAGLRVLFTVRAGIVTPGTDTDALPRVNGGSPAVTVSALEQSIRQVAMGKRYTHFDLPSIRKLQRGARIIRLENCCRMGPLPTEK